MKSATIERRIGLWFVVCYREGRYVGELAWHTRADAERAKARWLEQTCA